MWMLRSLSFSAYIFVRDEQQSKHYDKKNDGYPTLIVSALHDPYPTLDGLRPPMCWLGYYFRKGFRFMIYHRRYGRNTNRTERRNGARSLVETRMQMVRINSNSPTFANLSYDSRHGLFVDELGLIQYCRKLDSRMDN